MDGRKISAPLAWYPRLFDATPEQKNRWETSGGGFGIHWPDIDEDLTMLFASTNSSEYRVSKGRKPVFTGIGVHSGPVIISTVGSDDLMDSTVLGDSVNLAARLEGLTKYFCAFFSVASYGGRGGRF